MIKTWIKKLRTLRSYWWFWLFERDHIDRIIMLVQYHPEFFGPPRIGSSCAKAAADTLERLIKLEEGK